MMMSSNPHPPITIRCNDDGQTTLHLLCKDRFICADTVQQELEIHPHACEIQDIYRRTPLYYAIKSNCASTAVIDILCHQSPSAVLLRDVCGQCPLYMAYRYGVHDSLVAKLLLYQPQVTLQKTDSFSGKTLVESLMRPYEHMVFPTPHALWKNAYLTDGWNKMIHTLRAAHGCIISTDPTTRTTKARSVVIPELHMALDLWRLDIIGLGVLRNMSLLYAPTQSKLPTPCISHHEDNADHRRLPLATWVAHCNPVTMKTSNSSSDDAATATQTTSSLTATTTTARQSIASYGLLQVLQWLIQAHSDAAYTKDALGQYPLHIALSTCICHVTTSPHPLVKSPSSNSLAAAAAAAVAAATSSANNSLSSAPLSCTSTAYYQQLINAAPDVLTIPDPITKLVPCLLAASNPDVDLDTVYTLLREGPHVFHTLL